MTLTPRWIVESEVVQLLDLPRAIDAITDVLRDQANARAVALDKTQVAWGAGHTLHALGGAWEPAGLVGTKTWTHTAGGATPLLIMWDAHTGELRAIVEAFALGQLRTAAMSGVATELLAPPNVARAALIGTGKQALPQLAAMLAARRPQEVRIFSPSNERRRAFVESVRSAGVAADVIDSPTLESAVSGAQLITTVTRSKRPFLKASMLTSPVHINAVGAIGKDRAELAHEVYAMARIVVADSVDDARRLSTEVAPSIDITPLCDLARRGAESWLGVTVFKAMGTGLADLALGRLVLEKATEHELGRVFDAPRKAAPRLIGGTS